jgi:hypothetical protein
MKRFHPKLTGLVMLLAVMAPAVVFAASSPTYTYQGLLNILYNLIGYLIRIAGVAVVAVITWFGLQMVFARGDPTKYGKAKTGLLWAVVGAAVIFGVYTIILSIRAFVNSLSGQ